VWAIIRAWHDAGLSPRVVIEDYIGSGPQSAVGQMTTKQIGFIYWSCEFATIPVTLQMPQYRKSTLSRTRAFTTHIHEGDALAHAFAFLKKGLGHDLDAYSPGTTTQ